MKEHRNPDGLRHCDFIEQHKDIPHLAEICWYFGVQPEQLKNELFALFGVQNGVQIQNENAVSIENTGAEEQ